MGAGNVLLELDARPIIAHRGASGNAPENTLAAFELAVRQGADALELDVRVTKDGAAVVMHDALLDRTTDFTGPVRGRTLAELRMADAGYRFTRDRGQGFPFRGRGVRVPTLAEVLWAFPRIPVIVELKEPEVQQAVRRVLTEERAVERCLPAAEDGRALELFRDGPYACGACSADIAALYWAVAFRRQLPPVSYRFLSVPVRHRGLPVPTRRFVAAARRIGCPVHVWTVNDAATARRLWARGVAGIVTNVPEVVLAARRARG